MNLFVDSNVWLSFYHYTSDDLEALRKIAVLLKSGELSLFLPEQVRDEVRRNRELKIADAIGKFKKEELPSGFPRLAMQYPEYEATRTALRDFSEAKNALLEKIAEDASNRQLAADLTIQKIFAEATRTELSADILANARTRMDLGNPPGKAGSLGDAINWESLLLHVPHGEDLAVITADKDFRSPTDDTRLSHFLEEEWERRKVSTIRYHSNLASYLYETFPDVRLATELEKTLMIRQLADADSFREARRLLRRLAAFAELDDSQVREVADASIANNQIYWIATDSDINGLLKKLVWDRQEALEPDQLVRFESVLEYGDPWKSMLSDEDEDDVAF